MLLHPTLPSKTQHDIAWFVNQDSSYVLALAQTITAHDGVVVLITENNLQARQLEEELQFFLGAAVNTYPILHFPDWETLPYDHFSPHQDIISERLRTLHDLPQLQRGVLITAITTLMQKVAPLSHIELNTFLLQVGQQFQPESFRERLVRCNYVHVSKVMEHGEFSMRGSIIDVFPMGSEAPFRIDLFDNEIETIKIFDVDTQCSTTTINQINILPAKEFPLTETGITQFRQRWRARFAGNPVNCPIYHDVSEGLSPAGIEYYLPLFFSELHTLIDYLPASSLIIKNIACLQMAEKFWQEIRERYEQLNYDVTRPLLAAHEIFLPTQDIFAAINRFPNITMRQADPAQGNLASLPCQPLPNIKVDHKAKQPLAELAKFIATQQRVCFCVESAGRREALLELLADDQIHPKSLASFAEFIASDTPLAIVIGRVEQGFCVQQTSSVISENDLLQQTIMQRRQRQARKSDSDIIIRDLAELKIGTKVVHLQHGVGRYLGLQTITTNNIVGEYLTLQYDGNDKVYVPITSLDLISRYSGSNDDHVPLHKLGTDRWEKAKRKAIEKIQDVAAELLDIYAKREALQGIKFTLPDGAYHNFTSAFPYEPTIDQEQAFAQVIADMTSTKKMDRLICGDVGFGKTEVAMRAAFIAAYNGRQVAILVPTTLLANQHYESFKNRFADFPVSIDLLSRFRTKAEQDVTLANLAAGKVDIVIGTHKIIQSDLKFANLGLLIIDEEHRFGVKQKETLKKFRSEVDMLAMTATPIPRTLNLSLSGVRDISIIATPPEKRLSIKTFAHQFQPSIIREAILREILRGGQVFYLHNNVDTIPRISYDLTALVPEASIGIAHGQMHERELEKVMNDFYHRRFNVLLCTTIIETGIDIPTANTIIIDRADHFGLAQLHQLRGRVGRSHHQAYAYLIVPDTKSMTSDAQKRIEAFLALDDLGAGFTLATHDMEIRGAGEILGEEQSGHIEAIGFSLYMDMLNRAVHSLKLGKHLKLNDPFEQTTEINLQISAIIPDDYIPDVHIRLTLYKRIASALDNDELKNLQVEMIDRFGLLPEPVKLLFQVTELKLIARPLGIKRIEGIPQGCRIEFTEHPNIEPMTIIKLMQREPKRYQLDGPTRLKCPYQTELPAGKQRIDYVRQLLNELSAGAKVSNNVA